MLMAESQTLSNGIATTKQSDYKELYKVFISYGLERQVSKAAAYILTKDDPTKKNFGRSRRDELLLTIVWLHINEAERKRRNEWTMLNEKLTGNGENLLRIGLM